MSKSRRPRHMRPVPHPLPAIPAPVPTVEAAAPPVDDELAPETILPVAMVEPEPAPTFDALPFDALPFDAPAEEPALDIVEAASVPLPAPVVEPVATAQMKAESFGATMMNYVIGEGDAFAAHMRALAGARSMAEFVRLQIGEFQRAADATLTCWGVLTLSASRTVSMR